MSGYQKASRIARRTFVPYPVRRAVWKICLIASRSKKSRRRRSRYTSKSITGHSHLRYYPAHDLVAWQPRGVLDDGMVDEIADWLVIIEKELPPLKRFVDFTRLTKIAVRTRHVYEISERRIREYTGLTSLRTALFCNLWIGFGIALLYETLVKGSRIEARAFRDRTEAAEWLSVPPDILTLADKPAPHS